MDTVRLTKTFASFESHPIHNSFIRDNYVVNFEETCHDCAPKPVLEKNQNQCGSQDWRRTCGCLKTSQKLKQLLKNFPEPGLPPPPPVCTPEVYVLQHTPSKQENDLPRTFSSKPICCNHVQMTHENWAAKEMTIEYDRKGWCDTWRLLHQVLSMLQLMVTASALAVYYLIYCYMQLIYFTLQSAIYFHNADPSMKVTIAVVSITSIILGINVVVRIERIMGF